MTRAGGRIGPYEVMDELGRGGLGVVYRARHPRTGGQVAVKVLFDPNPQATKRFQREARAAASLRHPGVVAVHDLGEQDGRPYLVMELIEGETLAARLRRGPLPEEEARRLTREVADALACAHAAGLLHRDVKPGNVLIDRLGRARLTDFGLAREQQDPERLTRTGVLLGTPTYMAPEQMDDASRAGAPADVYALGATLYQALTGSPPLVRDGLASQINAVLTVVPASPAVLRPGLSRDLDRVCMRCLAKEPGERPTAAELAGLLAAAAPGPATESGRRAPRAGRSRGSGPLKLGVGVLACGSLAAGAIVLARPRATPVPAPAPAAPVATASPPPAPPEPPPEPYPGFRADAQEILHNYTRGTAAWLGPLRQLLEAHPEEPLWHAFYEFHLAGGLERGRPWAELLARREATTALENKIRAIYLAETGGDQAEVLRLLDAAWALGADELRLDDSYFHYYGLAVMAALREQPEQRERRLRWAIEHNQWEELRGGIAPNKRFHYFYLAETYRALGRDEEALAALERIYELDPGYPQASMYLGEHFLAVGDAERACEAWQRCVDLAEQVSRQLGPAHAFSVEVGKVADHCRKRLAEQPGR